MVRKWPSAAAFAVLSALLIGLGCSRPGQPEDEPEDIPPIEVPPEDLKALVEGNNRFAIDLYKQVAAKTDGNIILSPYSISSALAMTYAGARGQTAEEMRKVLHFTLPDEKLHAAFGGTTKWLQAVGNRKKSELSIANALWAQRGLGFVPEFLSLTNKSYGVGLREVDFAGNPEAARGTINRWVEEQTRDRIKELLTKQDITPKVRLVLTNAVYFKGLWVTPFPKERTSDRDFETKLGVKVKVRMMSVDGAFRFHGSADFGLLELPYEGDRLSMLVLLPNKRCGLLDVENTLTEKKLSDGIAKMSSLEGTVALPKFKTTSRFELVKPLMQLGMVLPFTNADFSGIAPGLGIANVIHGGDFEVDEYGTEAAATTAVIMVRRAMTFTADHPFLYLVVDRTTGTILFLGRFIGPD